MSRLSNLDIMRNYLSIVRCSIHSAVPYMVTVAPIWPLDDKGSWFFDGYMFEVHLFAMELFFILAGFMLAIQLANKSIKEVVIDRFRRIVVPLAIGIFLFVPMVLAFFHLKERSTYNWASLSNLKNAYFSGWKVGLEHFFPTGHLWFLYYLILFIVLVLAAVVLNRKYFNIQVSVSPRIFFIFSIISSIGCMYFMKRWIVDNPLTFVPEWSSFVHYFLFFIIGLLIYDLRSFADYFSKHSKTFITVGLLIGILALGPQVVFKKTDLPFYQWIRFFGICGSITATYLLTTGIWGRFSKITRKTTAFENYMTGASYWIYLSNMLFVLAIQLVLIPLSLPVFVKFFITLIFGIVFSTLTYEFLVKNTWFGSLLKMRRHNAKKRFW